MKFHLTYFPSILRILSIKFSLKVLAIKCPLEYFLLIPETVSISKTRCGSQLACTFKRPDVAHSLLALSKDQMWLTAYWHFQKTKCGS